MPEGEDTLPPRKRWPPVEHTAVGVHVSLPIPEAIECFGLMGFEWVFLDAQHSPLIPRDARELVRAADLCGMPVIVRVAEIVPSIIEAFLDVGVQGILAPDVRTVAQAQSLAAAVRFPPQGKRGSAPRSRAAGYGLQSRPSLRAADSFLKAKEAVLAGVLLESTEGLDRLEAIAAVPGIEAIAIGANDLALSLGMTDSQAPAVRTLVEDAERRIRAIGKTRIAVVSNVQQGQLQSRAGASLIAVNDLALLSQAALNFLAGIRSSKNEGRDTNSVG